jgi:ABC-type glycerol-3-phosphate transport system substrate-binding protein
LQLAVRIQLDTTSTAPRIVESVDIYNSEQYAVKITIVPTPPYNSTRAIAFNRPTLAVDGRWSDFAGGTMEDISIYLDPKNQRVHHLMHYRRDIFQRHNVSGAPQTVQELLQVARQLNGTDFDGDGTPDYALCYNMQQHCGAPYMFTKLLLSMMFYTTSTLKPLTLDPDTLEPNVMNAAVRAALQELADLSQFNAPASSANCYSYDTEFCAGAKA